jgi:hypothetical protein
VRDTEWSRYGKCRLTAVARNNRTPPHGYGGRARALLIRHARDVGGLLLRCEVLEGATP